MGLFCDNGRAISPSTFGPKADRFLRRIVEVFQENQFKVTVKANLVQTDFSTLFLISTAKNFGHSGNQTKIRYIH